MLGNQCLYTYTSNTTNSLYLQKATHINEQTHTLTESQF